MPATQVDEDTAEDIMVLEQQAKENAMNMMMLATRQAAPQASSAKPSEEEVAMQELADLLGGGPLDLESKDSASKPAA